VEEDKQEAKKRVDVTPAMLFSGTQHTFISAALIRGPRFSDVIGNLNRLRYRREKLSLITP
jgi:hypothetical protein